MNAGAIEGSGDTRRRGDWIGAEGEAADAMDRPGKGFDLLPERLADQQAALGVQTGLFAVEIEITFAAGGESHLPLFIRKVADNLYQTAAFLAGHKGKLS